MPRYVSSFGVLSREIVTLDREGSIDTMLSDEKPLKNSRASDEFVSNILMGRGVFAVDFPILKKVIFSGFSFAELTILLIKARS